MKISIMIITYKCHTKYCPIIILRDFNINILDDNNHLENKLVDIMNRFKLKSQFHESTTKVESQLDHIWANVLKNACKLSVMGA
jgi:hypothetical protein